MTLTGPGGTDKTRLSLRASRDPRLLAAETLFTVPPPNPDADAPLSVAGVDRYEPVALFVIAWAETAVPSFVQLGE